jgi:RNA methyltransferase, TrmH family
MIASPFPAMPTEIIRSRDNALVRRFRAQRRQGATPEVGLLEGFKLIEEALAAGLRLDAVALCTRAEAHPRCAPLLAALDVAGVGVRFMTDEILDSLSEAQSSQGVLALAQRPRFEEGRLYRGTPLILVAVGIQNPGNLGALLRTAEAAGASGAYLTGATADAFSWKALRGAMGSAFRLPQVREPNIESVLERLRGHGVTPFAATLGAALRYDQADLRGPVAIVVGNEGAGLPDEVVRACTPVAIPMAAPVESLNVGVAAGVLLFEAARQRR